MNHADMLTGAAVTPAAEMDEAMFTFAAECAAEVAIATGRPAVIVGLVGERHLLVCDAGCCVNRPGAVVAVPDLVGIEAAANGKTLPETMRLARADGREVAFYHAPTAVRR